MTAHADIVREFLDGNNVEGVRSARAALDALVAERDEALAHAARSLTGWQGAVSLAEAAEARITELEMQVQQYNRRVSWSRYPLKGE